MLHTFNMRRRARKIFQNGLGPFTSACLIAFSQCRCQRCAKPVPENSLFGNALVVQDASILVLCSACRIGEECVLYPAHPFRSRTRNAAANNTVDRIVVLAETDWLTAKGDLGFSYHDLLLCLRHGYGHFQEFRRKPFAGYSATIVEDAKRRFGRPLPGSCGECGALWANEWELSRDNSEDILRDREYSDVECYACGFPHSHQWFMRTSFAEERRSIGAG